MSKISNKTVDFVLSININTSEEKQKLYSRPSVSTGGGFQDPHGYQHIPPLHFQLIQIFFINLYEIFLIENPYCLQVLSGKFT